MRILEPLVRKPAGRPAERFSFQEWVNLFAYNGNQYPYGIYTSLKSDRADPVSHEFMSYVDSGYRGNGVVATCEFVRLLAFSEARFQFQQMRRGRPDDLFGNPSLSLLERPWPEGTTGDLLSRMLIHADMAGNWYGINEGSFVRTEPEIVNLRPDWVEIILEPRLMPVGKNGAQVTVGSRKVGIFYYEGGKGEAKKPAVFLRGEFAHFAPLPDPSASYRGMSWLTPVIREMQADTQATKHKLKFFENAATPNLAVSFPLPPGTTPMSKKQFDEFVEAMETAHRGTENAYKTLYTANGADVTVIGADMKQLDFKVTQGAGETRIAAAAGVGAVVAQLSEGLAGSSLNAGNFSAARRRFADLTMRPLWRNAAGSLEVLVPPPADARLWYDPRDVGFLREDEKDAAEIQQIRSTAIRQLIDAGYEPASVVAAIENDDFSLLEHTNLFSVQLQPAGAQPAPPA